MTTLTEARTRCHRRRPRWGSPSTEAVPMFLDYLRCYRSCSPLSIRTYAADLRCFQILSRHAWTAANAFSNHARRPWSSSRSVSLAGRR